MIEHKYLTDEEIVGLYLSCPPVAKPLRADLAAYRAELKAAQKDRGRIQMYLDDATAEVARLNMRLNEKHAEIARLREDNHKIARAVYPHKNPHYPFSTSTEFIVEEIHRLHQNQAELDRMRKALEGLASKGCVIYPGSKTLCPVEVECTGCLASRALNPQPAQPEKA